MNHKNSSSKLSSCPDRFLYIFLYILFVYVPVYINVIDYSHLKHDVWPKAKWPMPVFYVVRHSHLTLTLGTCQHASFYHSIKCYITRWIDKYCVYRQIDSVTEIESESGWIDNEMELYHLLVFALTRSTVPFHNKLNSIINSIQ